MSLVAAAIERIGIPTVAVVFLRGVAERIRPPRALWVPYAHGYALGEPNNPLLQRAVLEGALRVVDESAVGPVVRDFTPPRD